jgi:hypothetical protein
MQERRAAARLRTDLHTRWEALKGQSRASVCDLSSPGCFLLAGADVAPGELIRRDMTARDEIFCVWGTSFTPLPKSVWLSDFCATRVAFVVSPSPRPPSLIRLNTLTAEDAEGFAEDAAIAEAV